MKKHLLSAFLLGALCSFGQVPNVKWQKSLGGTNTDKGNAVTQSADGGYVIAGETMSSDGDITLNHGTTDYWVTKIDSATGAMVWQKSLGGSGDDRANAITATSDGGYMVVGASNTPAGNGDITVTKGQYDFWMVKLTSAGVISFQKNLGGTAIDEARAVQQTSDGGFIIVGESRSNDLDLTVNNGSSDFWVVKTDNAGVILWQKALGGSGTDIARSVMQTADGGYIIAGESNSPASGNVTGNKGGNDFWVVKLDGSGTLTWQKNLGGSGNEVPYSVRQTSDGGYIVAGKTDSNNSMDVGANNGGENAWVVKLTSTGSITWQKCYGGTGFDAANSILQTVDGGYIFGGQASSNTIDVSGNHGSYDFWVVKLTSTGVLSWQKCLGGSAADVAMSILIAADNGYLVAGRSTSNGGDITNAKGLDDFWVVKFVGPGATAIGIPERMNNNGALSIYPNPGKGIFNISSSHENGAISIVNAAGQIIYRSEIKPDSFQADLSGAAKGLYLVQVSDANGTVTGLKKLIIE